MPDVVILTARFGHGHLSAAENIREALTEEHPDLSVEILDPFQATNPRSYAFARRLYRLGTNHFPRFYHWVYLWLDRTEGIDRYLCNNRAMSRFFMELYPTFQPRVVVSTYPANSALVEHHYGPAAGRPFRFFTVITDSVTINQAWVRGESDGYFVADPLTEKAMQKLGVPAARITVTGFPTPPFFVRHPRPPRPETPAGRPPALTLLYLPNQGVRTLFHILRVLCSAAVEKIIMPLGNRGRLIRRTRRFGERLKCRMEVTGWVPGIHRRMLEADLVITKAGGATVHEALAAGCPVIISRVTPGQEEGNARLIESLGLGLVVRDDPSLLQLVKFLRQVDFVVLDTMRRNVENFRRVDAPFRIARHVRAALADAATRDDAPRPASGPEPGATATDA